MISISVKDTDIQYPLNTLTAYDETENMSLAQKKAFLDKSLKEIEESLKNMLFGNSPLFDKYCDDLNTTEDGEKKIA